MNLTEKFTRLVESLLDTAQAHIDRGRSSHVKAHERVLSETRERMRLLDPNGDSRIKIEGYSFPFGQNITMGTACAIGAELRPTAMIKPNQVFMNAPCPGFVTISCLLIANINAILGEADDAFTYHPLARPRFQELPLLDVTTKASVAGCYTGLVPPPFATGFVFPFKVTLIGPAVLCGSLPADAFSSHDHVEEEPLQ